VLVLPCILQEFTQEEFAKMLRFSGSNLKVELVLRLLGLAHACDTLLGSAMVRALLYVQLYVRLYVCSGL
jgi:hypothetical protein